ncbi:TIGR01906 family membrane protein [Natronincola ferrireducens]|uniref:Integral membrane protein TIGR01906 n=1 Tax=Natronincola ferrireducens TaxID=393762 RepID=A0A1G8Y6R5_9FIRM|nr:TIGR01906 family membrane protein [Natronincola ferrireducens]SDJ97855.1 integral membrane protein TIGR01906 [Natronincola ferrireducens]
MKRIIYIAFGILLSLVLLLTAVDIVAFNMNHYKREFAKHDITTVTGMDDENLQHVTKELLSYLRDERDDLKIEAVVRGEKREVFGEREKLHMIDVKDLFVGGRKVRKVSLIILGLLLILFIKTDKDWKRNLAKTFMFTGMVNIDLIILLFLLMHFDFTKYFDYFHYIFFDNDLWILDPNTEILIQMLPQEFFFNTAVKIALIYAGTIIALGIGGFWYKKRQIL